MVKGKEKPMFLSLPRPLLPIFPLPGPIDNRIVPFPDYSAVDFSIHRHQGLNSVWPKPLRLTPTQNGIPAKRLAWSPAATYP